MPAGYVLLRGAASMNSAPGAGFMMTIAVFVRATLEHHFSNVLVGRVTCGMGNKVREVIDVTMHYASQSLSL